MIRLLATLCLLIPISRASANESTSDTQISARKAWIEQQMPKLVRTYQWLHTHPEVSFQEQETAKFIAQQWGVGG